jgi:hypothetical protein
MEISRNKMRLIAGSESYVQRGCTISQYMNFKKIIPKEWQYVDDRISVSWIFKT